MNRILDRLYLGASSDLDGATPAALAPCTAVLTLCEQAPPRVLKGVHYPMPDERYLGIPAWDTAVLLLADWVIAGETVLVHCRLGVSRAPAVVAAYLVVCGHSADFATALATVTAIRPIVKVHSETRRGVEDFLAARERMAMPQEADVPCPIDAGILLCTCGAILLDCPIPACQGMHRVRVLQAAGACTATGGQPVEDTAC